jgi:hypothetical protein
MLIKVVSEAQNIYTKYIKNDIETCQIIFNNKLGSSSFEVYYIILYSIILHYITLYYIILLLYCIILYFTLYSII